MNIFRNNNTLIFGILIGFTVPVLAYAAIESVFDLLTQSGFMDEVTAATEIKRKRTLSLVSLCSNILAVQFFKKRAFEKILNGIVTATIIYASIWIVVFKVI